MPEYACVNYLGYLSRAEVLDLYKRSSIGAATILNIGQYNTGDNFATKVYEYMSMGLPVLVSRYPYAEKVLERYKFGMSVDPENIDEIADAIRYITDNPEIAKQMGENGRRAVLEEFNWGIEEKKLLGLYERIIDDIKEYKSNK
jgi:glycosyltransferase involved in cell wall biosynthesis